MEILKRTLRRATACMVLLILLFYASLCLSYGGAENVKANMPGMMVINLFWVRFTSSFSLACCYPAGWLLIADIIFFVCLLFDVFKGGFFSGVKAILALAAFTYGGYLLSSTVLKEQCTPLIGEMESFISRFLWLRQEDPERLASFVFPLTYPLVVYGLSFVSLAVGNTPERNYKTEGIKVGKKRIAIHYKEPLDCWICQQVFASGPNMITVVVKKQEQLTQVMDDALAKRESSPSFRCDEYAFRIGWMATSWVYFLLFFLLGFLVKLVGVTVTSLGATGRTVVNLGICLDEWMRRQAWRHCPQL